MVREIFRAEREEVTGEWRKLHNEELHGWNPSPYWSDQIKEREMGRGCGMYGGRDMSTGFWCGSLKERDLMEDQSVDGSILLKLIFMV